MMPQFPPPPPPPPMGQFPMMEGPPPFPHGMPRPPMPPNRGPMSSFPPPPIPTAAEQPLPPAGFMPAAPMMPVGPLQPVIFEGHLTNTGSKEIEVLQEIQFGHSFKFEGIHIVPNQYTPPGFNIIGRTKPDIRSRPFQLQIHGRVSSSGEFVLVLALTIQGGVQWIPVPHPLCTVDFDYLAFSGDYQEITTILHGYPNLPNVDSNYDFSKHPKPLPPYPFYFDDMVASPQDLLEIRRYLPTSSRFHENKAFENLKQYDRQTRTKTLKEILALPLTNDIPRNYFASKVSTTRSNSLLPVQLLAELVEKVFTLPTTVQLRVKEDYDSIIGQISSLNSILLNLHQVTYLSSVFSSSDFSSYFWPISCLEV